MTLHAGKCQRRNEQVAALPDVLRGDSSGSQVSRGFRLPSNWRLLANPAAGTPTSATATLGPASTPDRKLENHIRQIQALGFSVALTKAA